MNLFITWANNKSRLFAISTTLILLLLPGFAQQAENESPDALIKRLTQQLAMEVLENKPVYIEDRDKLLATVDMVLSNGIDFPRTARLVLGKYWRSATKSQKIEFIRQFKQMLLRTYSRVLLQYTGEEAIIYHPLKLSSDASRVVVKTEISVAASSPKISLHYKLSKNNSGQWLVYDLIIEGVSIVASYRNNYAAFLQRNSIDALNQELANKLNQS